MQARKLIVALLFIAAILASFFVITASASTGDTTEFAGGSGTKSDPYIIASKEHLLNVKNHLSSYYKMISDIEFTDDDYSSTGILSNGWNSIGSSTKPFTGYFDGNNHNIVGLKKSSTFSGVLYLGLFGWNEGTIINTNVVNCDFNAVCTDPGHFGAYAGGIVAWNKGIIEHCSSSGIIYGTNGAGGIVGENYSGSITRSYNFCTVSSNNAGGIVGINDRSVSNCYNTGAISGSTAGGIVGEGWMPSYCYNVGVVNGDYYCGGILGYFPSSYSGGADGSNCYYLDNVTSGVGYISKADLTIKLSSSQMTQKESFEKLDFATIWKYDASNNYHYPIIRNKIDYSSFFAGGDGTEAAPFEISNTEELNNITKDTSAYYKLTCNIVFTDSDYDEGGPFASGWTPFVFSGIFDGCGFSIINLRVSTVAKTIHTATTVFNCETPALFSINNGTIKNLTIKNARYSVNAGVYNGGIICAENNGTITNCHSQSCLVVFNSSNHFGGIVGDNKGTIQNCTSENTITLDSKAGKIGGIASNNSGNIIGCTNKTAIISAGSDYSTTGGIVATNSGKIIQCRNLAPISTTSTYQNRSAYSGGIVGSMSAGEITECYNNALIYATTNKYSSNTYAGGLVGYLSGGKISNSYNIGNISASNNAYSGIAYVGGLIGYNKTIDDVVNCYSICQVQGYSSEDVYAGLICGYNSVATIKNCYYAGIANSAVGFGDATYIHGINKETLQLAATYDGFDFTAVWSIQGDTYPYPQLISNLHVCNHVFSNDWSYNDSNHWYICTNEGCNATNGNASHNFDHACDQWCNDCGFARTISHIFDGEWLKNDICHWKECTVDGCTAISVQTTHNYSDNNCESMCVCGFVNPVKHSFSASWKYDDAGHWHKCQNWACTAIEDFASHSYTSECDNTCDCGYTRSRTHDFTGSWQTNENAHWHVCLVSGCGEIDTMIPHQYSDACDTTCDCGYTRTTPHDFSAGWYDASGHWRICVVCLETDTKIPHQYGNDCTEVCDCGYSRSISHDFTGTWQKDDSGHWHICTHTECQITDTKSPHQYSNACDSTCDCGYTRTTTHNFTGVYQKDASGHWHICQNNGCNVTDTKLPHQYSYNCDATCDCGYTRTVAHDFTGDWQKDVNGHWRVCSTNGCTAIDSKHAHQYSNDCDATCACGYERTIEHDFTSAWKNDADAHWRICQNNGCKLTGEKFAHIDENHDNQCDECNQQMTAYNSSDNAKDDKSDIFAVAIWALVIPVCGLGGGYVACRIVKKKRNGK